MTTVCCAHDSISVALMVVGKPKYQVLIGASMYHQLRRFDHDTVFIPQLSASLEL